MESPLVSILLPTYEPNPRYLREALESLMAQTEERWHLIIHDDASEADVRAMVEPFLRDPRVTFTRSEKRLGIGGNWNACLNTLRHAGSGASYVQFLFQDDRWSPTYLQRALAILEANPEIGFVATHHQYAFEGDGIDRTPYETVIRARETLRAGRHDGRAFLWEWFEQGLHPNLIGEPSFVLLRRALVDKVGRFVEDMPQSLDAEYWMRCLLHTDWYFLRDTAADGDPGGGTFRVHPEGASSRNQLAGLGLFDRFRTMEELVHLLPAHDRLRARAILTGNLATMIRKFLARRQQQGAVSLGGSGALKRFCLAHPLLTLRAWRLAIAKEKP